MKERATSLFLSKPVLPLAVTGGIAEGKSTVLGYLAEAGFQCLSADDVVRTVLADSNIWEDLARLKVSAKAGSNEEFLLAMARDPQLRRKVNLLLHPPVLEHLVTSGAQAVEVPLLFEACLQPLFQRVWVVTCGREEQLRRLTVRTGDIAKAKLLASAQLDSQVKCAFADRIVRTNRPPFDVHSHVVSLAHRLNLS